MSESRMTFIYTSPNRRKGMTFTEVLVATAILAFAMVPILKAMTNAHIYSLRMERKSKSLLFAQNQIEELRARAIADYDSFWSGSDLPMGDGYYCNVSADTDTELRTVSVTAGFDENQDHHLENGEVLACLRTRIARQQ